MKMQSSSFSLHPDNVEYIEGQWREKGKRNRSHWLDDLITHLRSKSEVKPKPPAAKEEMQYPPQLNIAAWEEWKAYRRENKMKAYKPTPRSEGAAVNNLIKLSKGDYNAQLLIVQQSMANGYQGLFEVKGNETSKQTNTSTSNSASDRVKAALEEQRREFFGCSEAMGDYDGISNGQMGEEEREGSIIDLDNGDWSTKR